jgi:hypothetical protein
MDRFTGGTDLTTKPWVQEPGVEVRDKPFLGDCLLPRSDYSDLINSRLASHSTEVNMTNAMIILLFWIALILVIWLVLRSRRFRDACENMQAMQDAPENLHKRREFETYMANPIHQLDSAHNQREQEKKVPHGD